jgi:hypothetical protein
MRSLSLNKKGGEATVRALPTQTPPHTPNRAPAQSASRPAERVGRSIRRLYTTRELPPSPQCVAEQTASATLIGGPPPCGLSDEQRGEQRGERRGEEWRGEEKREKRSSVRVLCGVLPVACDVRVASCGCTFAAAGFADAFFGLF